jgi:hypothetical protein
VTTFFDSNKPAPISQQLSTERPRRSAEEIDRSWPLFDWWDHAPRGHLAIFHITSSSAPVSAQPGTRAAEMGLHRKGCAARARRRGDAARHRADGRSPIAAGRLRSRRRLGVSWPARAADRAAGGAGMKASRNTELIQFVTAIRRVQAGPGRRAHIVRIQKFDWWLADCDSDYLRDRYKFQGSRRALEFLIRQRRREARQ